MPLFINYRHGGWTMGLLRSLIDSEYKELKKFEKQAKQIDALSEEMVALSDKELAAKTD